MKKRTVKVFLAAVIICIFFGYGICVGAYHIFPYDLIKATKDLIVEEPHISTNVPLQTIDGVEGQNYRLTTWRYSFFALDDNGTLLLNDSLPYRQEGICRFERIIMPGRTAIIIMDPWVDMVSDF